jgi:hypothetical protein
MTRYELDVDQVSSICRGNYDQNKNAVRKFALEYLKANAPDDVSWNLVEKYIRTSPKPEARIGSNGTLPFQKAKIDHEIHSF